MEYLELIDRTVSRCHEMAEGWRNFARGGVLDFKDVLLADAMRDVHRNALPMTPGPHVRVELIPGPDDIRIHVDHVQFMRAMNNITTNAIEALPPEGGMVALGWQRNGNTVEIVVEDNGSGIPTDIVDRIFEPHFTTKNSRGGMGIGLHITRRTIEMHRGTMTLTNKKEGGAIARICLPIVPPA
jgi:signal transduction histidine kinase